MKKAFLVSMLMLVMSAGVASAACCPPKAAPVKAVQPQTKTCVIAGISMQMPLSMNCPK